MEIQDINPWWKGGKIDKEIAEMERRSLFNELLKYIKNRQIIAITGLRQVGKTVLLHHIIDHLLRGIEKEKILYYNFDLLAEKSVEEILLQYKDMLGIDFKKNNIFIFLDEIQKHKNWENELKILYDNFRNIKFFISGSSSLVIEKKTKESLAGRAYSFELKPLSFKEYLKLKKLEYYEKNLKLYEKEIADNINNYIKTGGFPGIINEKDETKIKKYIKELVVDRIAYIDIPKVFEVDEPELLIKLLSIVSSRPGMLFDYDSVASDMKRNRKTISNYIFYLEKAFLIKKVYNFSKNLITSEKKLKKIYPSTTALAFLYNADLGSSIEATVLQNKEFKFFYRKNGKEIDFVNEMPTEVKYQSTITKQDSRSAKSFMSSFKFSKCIIITKDIEKKEKINGKEMRFIPLWKWLLR